MATFQNRILWWALLLSVVIYVVVAYAAEVPEVAPSAVDTLLPGFVLLSLGIGAGSLLYRRRALAGPIQSGRLDPGTLEGQQAAFAPFIVCLILSETVGVFGLVLSLLSGDLLYSVAFSLAAIALFFLHRPTAPDLVPPIGISQGGSDPTPIV